MNPAIAITLRTSRAKALPMVIFLPIFISLFGLAAYAFLYTAITRGFSGKDWLGLLFAVPFLFLLAAEILLLRRVLWPDTLTLTSQGWTLTRFGRPASFCWADYGEATKRWVSSGKSGSDQICLEPRDGGKRVFIPGEDFVLPFTTVFESVKQAQSGRLVEPPPATTPRLYAYVVVPISVLSTALLFSVVLFETWRINHL